MILFQNGFVRLVYDPSKDILSVEMPSVNYDLAADFKKALDIVVENVRNYDVKRLLVDARQSVIELEMEEYGAIVTQFSYDIKATRLQKVARVVSDSRERENMVRRVMDEVQPVLVMKSFTDVPSAIEWLVK